MLFPCSINLQKKNYVQMNERSEVISLADEKLNFKLYDAGETKVHVKFTSMSTFYICLSVLTLHIRGSIRGQIN